MLEHADRVVFLDGGRLVLDAPADDAVDWLAVHRPEWVEQPRPPLSARGGDVVCRLRGVRFAYRGGPAVLDDYDLDLRRGEVVALSGPNGVGKTTIAKLAAGLLEPDVGEIRRVGRAALLLQDPGRYSMRERADEEVALGVGGNLSQARAALALVGLRGLEARHPRDLASGERERLALASVLVTEPDLLVLDEPTRGVDPARKAELAALLRAGASGRATLVVSHDANFVAAVADHTLGLGRKKAVHA